MINNNTKQIHKREGESEGKREREKENKHCFDLCL